MAFFKNTSTLKSSENGAFDIVYMPRDPTPHSGVYKCTVCGHEIVSTESFPLSPKNHFQHPVDMPIRWKLLVAAEHNSSFQ